MATNSSYGGGKGVQKQFHSENFDISCFALTVKQEHKWYCQRWILCLNSNAM